MKHLYVLILVVFVGIGAFFAGMKYQQSKQPSRADFQGMRGTRQPGNMPGQEGGSGMVRGEIINQDKGSITVKLPDDSSKIVLISENTEINKATEATTDDLTTGEQVMVFGETNSDGSVSATQIQLNPQFREGFNRMHQSDEDQ